MLWNVVFSCAAVVEQQISAAAPSNSHQLARFIVLMVFPLTVVKKVVYGATVDAPG